MSTNTNRLERLVTLLEQSRNDHDKFFTSGNNAAGTRLRKAMQEVKTLAQELRIEVQDAKNAE
jgi:hypothetical protein